MVVILILVNLSSIRTRAEYAALNGCFLTKKTFFIYQMAKSTAYYAA